MKLDEFIEMLLTLQAEGHGDKQVLYRHGNSDDCGELSHAFVTARVSECGPFDLEDGEEYISVYAGN